MKLAAGNLLVLCIVVATAIAGPVDKSAAVRDLSNGVNELAFKLFEDLSEKNVNLATSPLSTAILLSVASHGAGGKTKQQLQNVFQAPDNLSPEGYQSIAETLHNVRGATLKLVTEVITSEGVSVKPEFKDLIKSYFHAGSQSVNFGNAAEAAKTINKLVRDQTDNHITEIISDKGLDAKTKLVLLNAMYFKGLWDLEFDKDIPSEIPFKVDENTEKRINMMFRHSHYNYAEVKDLNSKVVEIPYKDKQLAMLVILPNEGEKLANVEKKLKNTNLANIRKEGRSTDLNLYLPRFKIETELQPNDKFERLGLAEVFTEKADFSGITEEKLKVDQVLQKVSIEVNDDGKPLVADDVAPPTKVTLVLFDRPFHYIVFDTSSNLILLEGHVYDPSLNK